jgi:predicted PhzF superfamily epimerase YddE/YHI9
MPGYEDLLEKSVTGSAHCQMAPYWSKRLGKSRLRAKQISRRGGEILCEVRGERVSLTGNALTYLTGEIRLDQFRGQIPGIQASH